MHSRISLFISTPAPNVLSQRHTDRHMERRSVLLSIREMHIKMTRDHLTPVRGTIFKKSANSEYWWGCEEKGTLLHCWWECKLVQPLQKTGWRVLRKLKRELPYDPAIPLLGIYLEKYENSNLKTLTNPNVHRNTIYNSQGVEAT